MHKSLGLPGGCGQWPPSWLVQGLGCRWVHGGLVAGSRWARDQGTGPADGCFLGGVPVGRGSTWQSSLRQTCDRDRRIPSH